MANRSLTLILAALCLTTAIQAEAQFRPRPATVPGEDFHVELGAMFWQPTPEIVIGIDALNAVGTDRVDFVQEFQIEDKRFTELRVVLKSGRRHKIRFSYVPISYQEEATLQRTITFEGQTFAVGIDAMADIEWKLWRFGYEWDFVSMDRGLVGLLTEVKYNTVSATLQGQALTPGSPTLSASAEATAPVPALGLIGRGYLHRNVSVTAEYSGLKIANIADWFTDDEDFDVEFDDFDIYATVSLTRYIGLQGGYRSLSAEYLVDEDSGDLKMKGWYFGAAVRF